MSQQEYYVKLYSLEEKLSECSWIERTILWNAEYQKLSFPIQKNDLPSALALIHPNNWVDWMGNEINLSEDGWGPRKKQKCEFFQITGHECPWNENKLLQGVLHKDHMWPKSLGGPKSGFNLLILCSNHNFAKGNGLWGFDWNSVPGWLEKRIEQLQDMKLKGFNPNDL